MKKLILVVLFQSFLLSICSYAQMMDNKDDFYNPDKVREFWITFDQKNWPDVLDSIRLYGDGLLIGNMRIDGKSYQDVGFRYRGSKSFKLGSKRNAFHIKLNYINKKQNHQGYETLKLSNALRDPSMVREVLSYEIARKYMPAPQANYVKMYINGEYYGLFINLETVNDEFLEKHFGSNDNTFVKCSPSLENYKSPEGCKNKVYASLEHESSAKCYTANYELKSEEGWDDLIELTDVLNNDIQNIEKVLNVDRTLWMLAFNNVLVNLSSYTGQRSQNFYLYKDDYGRFNPVLWDMNLSFGSFKNTGSGSDLDIKELQRLDPLLHADNPAKPLISQLLKVPAYKKIYLSHLRTIVHDNFVDASFEKRAKELQRLIADPIFRDKNRFYTHDEFLKSLTTTIGRRSKIPGIAELMIKRGKFLKKHPQVSVIAPVVEGVTVLKRAKFSNKAVSTFNIQARVDKRPKKVRLFYRSDKSAGFTEVFMKDDGNSNDEKAGDKIFGVSIDPKGQFDMIEYYIVAENTGAVGFGPRNYMFEPFSATLSELNR